MEENKEAVAVTPTPEQEEVFKADKESGKIVLYGGYPFRATRPLWLLEELGVPYEQKRVAIHASAPGLYVKSEEYLEINPNGVVPTLIDGEDIIYESGAICLALADRFPEKNLAPPVSDTKNRSQYYMWIVYATATIDEPVIELYFQKTHKKEGERDEKLMDKCENKIDIVKEVLGKGLKDKQYLLGDQFSAADIVVGYSVWNFMGLLDKSDQVLTDYLERLKQRPAFQRTFVRKQ